MWLNDPTPYNGTTLGAYANGRPSVQANAAQGFEELASASSQIKGVNYYEFETTGDGVNEGSDGFDSALLGIVQPSFDQSGLLLGNGGEAVLRASYCVLAFGDTPTAALSDTRCDYGSYAGQTVAVTDNVEAYCSSAGTVAGSTPSKSGPGQTCAAASLNTIQLAGCTAVSFPGVILGAPWSDWQGHRQYAYKDCNGNWSYGS